MYLVDNENALFVNVPTELFVL